MKNIVLDSTAILRSELGEQSKLARAARGLPLTYSREFTNAVTQDGWRCFVRGGGEGGPGATSFRAPLPRRAGIHRCAATAGKHGRQMLRVYNPMRLPERGGDRRSMERDQLGNAHVDHTGGYPSVSPQSACTVTASPGRVCLSGSARRATQRRDVTGTPGAHECRGHGASDSEA
jgi:hypothetical protein